MQINNLEEFIRKLWQDVDPVYVARLASSLMNELIQLDPVNLTDWAFKPFKVDGDFGELVGNYGIYANGVRMCSPFNMLNMLCEPYDKYLTSGVPITVGTEQLPDGKQKATGFMATADLTWKDMVYGDEKLANTGQCLGFGTTDITKSRFYPGWDPAKKSFPPKDVNAIARIMATALNAFGTVSSVQLSHILFHSKLFKLYDSPKGFVYHETVGDKQKMNLFCFLSSMSGILETDEHKYVSRLAGSYVKRADLSRPIAQFGVTEDLMKNLPNARVMTHSEIKGRNAN